MVTPSLSPSEQNSSRDLWPASNFYGKSSLQREFVDE